MSCRCEAQVPSMTGRRRPFPPREGMFIGSKNLQYVHISLWCTTWGLSTAEGRRPITYGGSPSVSGSNSSRMQRLITPEVQEHRPGLTAAHAE